jgi:hypothetical protein
VNPTTQTMMLIMHAWLLDMHAGMHAHAWRLTGVEGVVSWPSDLLATTAKRRSRSSLTTHCQQSAQFPICGHVCRFR